MGSISEIRVWIPRKGDFEEDWKWRGIRLLASINLEKGKAILSLCVKVNLIHSLSPWVSLVWGTKVNHTLMALGVEVLGPGLGGCRLF